MPSRTGLPTVGNALRHTFKTLHVSLGISETLLHFLMGHALEGVSAKYIAELIVVHGPALRKAQEKISAHVFELLRLNNAPLVPTLPALVEPSQKKVKAIGVAGVLQ